MTNRDIEFGDILAFNGNGVIGNIIRMGSKGNVTHVAFCLNDTKLIESTMIDDSDPYDGVAIRDIDDKIAHYDGDVWHLKLKNPIMNYIECFEYAKGFIGFPYDKIQAAKSALDIFLDAKEDFNALFCSELCAALLRKGRVVRPDINASEVTPIDLCRLKLYSWSRCIKGSGKISRFNSINQGAFDEY